MNKRNFQRYDTNLQVLYEEPDKNPAPGTILNISLGGLYMISDSKLEKDTELTLIFSINKEGNESTLSTSGSVLRSGKIEEDEDVMKKYNITIPNGSYYAVLKFEAPFIELSFMLQS